MLGRFLVFLGGLVVVALFAALLAPLFVDWTDFRSDFEDRAGRILGKKVTVNGGVDARLLPFPSVTLHDVTVGRGDDGKPLVQVARFSMDAELAPFLSGEARIFDMRIEEPKIRLRLLKDGTLDWLRGSRADIPARTVVLESVHVSGGEIEFADEQTGRTRRISGIEADMSAKSLAGPWSVDGEAALDGEAGTFHLSTLQPDEATGMIPLKLRLTPKARPFEVELGGEFGLQDGKPAYAGTFQGLFKPLDATAAEREQAGSGPRVRGEFELSNERLRVATYRLELGDTGNPYAVTGEATLDTGTEPEFLLTADGQQIDVSRIGNEGTTGKTGRDPAGSVRQRLSRLIDIAAAIPIPSVPGRASLSLPALVAGDTVVRDIALDLQPAGTGWTVDRAVATLPGRTQVEAKGRLTLSGQPSFSGEMLVASTQPSGLSSWLSGGVDPAIRQLGSVGFDALVDLTPQLQRFEKLELAVGPATLKGRIERQSFKDAAPNLSVDLSGNAIDLDVIRALSLLIAGEDGGDGLFDHQIAARLKVDTLSAFDVRAEGVDTIFTIADSVAVVEKLDVADLAGAAIRASGRAEGALLDYSGTANLAFSASDPGPFFAILRDRLPSHPLLDRLTDNSAWYSDASLAADIAFGSRNGGGLGVRVGGIANGSRIDVNYQLADISEPAGAMQAEATLSNAEVSTLLGQAGLRPLPLPAGGDGSLTLSLKRAEAGPAETTFAFAAGGTSVTASGTTEVGGGGSLVGSGHIAVESDDLDPYLLMNGIALPQALSGLPIEGSADLVVSDATVAVNNIEAVVAGNRIDGELSLERATEVPKASGRLTVDTIDLPWLAENLFGVLQDPSTGSASEGAFSAPSWGMAEVAVRLESGAFSTGAGAPVSEFSADLGLRPGLLILEDIAGTWFGGKVDGRLALTNSDGNGFGEIRLGLDGGSIEDFYGGPSALPPATGTFDLTLAAEGGGNSVDALLSSLNGSGSLRLRDLQVARFNLGLFEPLLQEIDRIEGTNIDAEQVGPLVDDLLRRAPAQFGEVSVPFNITASTLRVQRVSTQTEQARVEADARLDLREPRLEASVEMSLAAGEEALDGAEPALRLTMEGEPFAPETLLDVTELSNYLSLRAFERERRRVETLQSNLLEKQRLRREVMLYRYKDEQRALARERAAVLGEAVEAEERRIRLLATERAEERRAEEEIRRQAEETARRSAEEKALQEAREAARRAAEAAEQTVREPLTTESVPSQQVLPVPPSEKVTRGGALPEVELQFDGLPGVN